MKKILLLLSVLAAPLAFGAASDVKIVQKNSADTAWRDVVVTPTGNTTIVFDSSLVPTITGTTGTGNVVRATSPTLVTPNLGAATGTSLVTTGNITAGGGGLIGAASTLALTGSGATTFRLDLAPTAANSSASSTIYNQPLASAGTASYARIGLLSGTNSRNFRIDTGGNGGATAGDIEIVPGSNATSVTGNLSVSSQLTAGGLNTSTGSNVVGKLSSTSAAGSVLQLSNTNAASTSFLFQATDFISTISFSAANLSTSGSLNVAGTTASTNSTTGALTVAGGVGVGGALNTGGNLITGGAVQVAPAGANNSLIRGTYSGTNGWLVGTGAAVGDGSSNATLGIYAYSGPIKLYGSGTLAATISNTSTAVAGNLTVSGTQNTFGLPATASALSTNSTLTFELTSNTSLKVIVRGSDGTTRSATLTLAP